MSKQYVGLKSKSVRDELESLESSLADFKYQREFEVPNGYFESSKSEVLASIQTNRVGQYGRVRRLLKPIMGVAAAIVLGILVFQALYTGEEDGLSIEDLEVTTLENYLLDQTEYLESDITVDYDLIDIID